MAETGRKTVIVDGSGTGHSAAHFSEKEVYFTFQKGATNNEAEYNGVILALEHLPAGTQATIKSDSQLVVYQLTGRYRCNYEHLNKKRMIIESLIKDKALGIKFEWIPREENKADADIRNHIGMADRPNSSSKKNYYR